MISERLDQPFESFLFRGVIRSQKKIIDQFYVLSIVFASIFCIFPEEYTRKKTYFMLNLTDRFFVSIYGVAWIPACIPTPGRS